MTSIRTEDLIFCIAKQDLQDFAINILDRRLSSDEIELMEWAISREFRHCPSWLEERIFEEFGTENAG